MTRAFIRAAFRQAIERNKDLDPTKRELEILKDKAFIENADDHKHKKAKSKRRALPNLKKILQTHGILSKDIKISEVKRILNDFNKTRTLKQNIKSNNLNLSEKLSNNRTMENNKNRYEKKTSFSWCYSTIFSVENSSCRTSQTWMGFLFNSFDFL